ncbi:hypothetical protein GCM10009550_64950 [Actinocorallia libanotica]|uniref:Uncharacterized protein n=1 Tax=Actinocorallia libanotica TaxID=46162 RepID=A0ABN1RVM7_9ACTN
MTHGTVSGARHKEVSRPPHQDHSAAPPPPSGSTNASRARPGSRSPHLSGIPARPTLRELRDKVDQMGLAHAKQHCFN